MYVPKNLQGPKTEFVSVGGKQKYLVDPHSREAVNELKKQLSLYLTVKKSVLLGFFPLVKTVFHKTQIGTTAHLIYSEEAQNFSI